MKVKTVVRQALARGIEKRINKHTNSMLLAASVRAKSVELHYAVRVNRLRSLLFGLQQES